MQAAEWIHFLKKNDGEFNFSINELKWKCPDDGWFKLNVNGARKAQSCRIGAGGVLRDHKGNWICGFCASLGVGQVIEAEAWGMLIGLKMTSERFRGKIVVECDSETLMLLLIKGTDELHPLCSILKSCRAYLSLFLETDIHHIYRLWGRNYGCRWFIQMLLGG